MSGPPPRKLGPFLPFFLGGGVTPPHTPRWHGPADTLSSYFQDSHFSFPDEPKEPCRALVLCVLTFANELRKVSSSIRQFTAQESQHLHVGWQFRYLKFDIN